MAQLKDLIVNGVSRFIGNLTASKITLPSSLSNKMLKTNADGEIVAATSGTDYQAPLVAGTDYQTPLPAQSSSTNGKFLQTIYDSNTETSNLSWETVDALPSQANNSGKFLTTNGTTASWANAPVTSVNGSTGAVTITDSDEKLKTTSLTNTNVTRYLIFGESSSTASVKEYSSLLKFTNYSSSFAWLTIGNSGSVKGGLRLCHTASNGYTSIIPSATEGRTLTLPDATGTVALTSDIPNVPSWALESSKPTYTASEVGAAASSHTHGDITSDGDIADTNTATIASGDRLVINDESESKLTNSSITFGTSTTKYLANDGTWQDLPEDSDTKVTQTNATYSSYTYWRSIPVGYSSVSSATGTTSTTTGTTYTFTNLKFQPSTGTLRARAFSPCTTDAGTSASNNAMTSDSANNIFFKVNNGADTILVLYSNGTDKIVRAGGSYDNLVDLGRSSTRWRNIYIGGTIYNNPPAATVASGDKILVNDVSENNISAGITLGSSTTQYLANDGSWQNIPDLADALPAVTSDDNGKVLAVVNGVWAVATVASLFPTYDGATS